MEWWASGFAVQTTTRISIDFCKCFLTICSRFRKYWGMIRWIVKKGHFKGNEFLCRGDWATGVKLFKWLTLELTTDQQYLTECTLGCADLVWHPQRNADHRGECEQPANDITPPWVHILIVVLKRSVFNEREGKSTLGRQNKCYYCVIFEDLWYRSVCWYSQCRWLGWRTTNSTWYKALGGSQSCPQCCHKSDLHLEKQ